MLNWLRNTTWETSDSNYFIDDFQLHTFKACVDDDDDVSPILLLHKGVNFYVVHMFR
jgi:hypothetical protein